MRACVQVKVLQMRGVSMALRTQHAQRGRAVRARAAAVGARGALQGGDLARGGFDSFGGANQEEAGVWADAPLTDGLESGSGSHRSSSSRGGLAWAGNRGASNGEEVTSWADDQYTAAAQLLRALRMRVLRLCAASVPASRLPTDIVRAASADPGTGRAGASSTGSGSGATLPARSAFAFPTDSAAGGAYAAPDPEEAGLIVRLLREMLDLCIPWTHAQGWVCSALGARAQGAG